jgi:hypothetical protein
MLDGLRQWFDSSDNDITLCPDDYHPTMQQILQQNQIGWAQVLLGRFSAAWGYQQRRYQLTQRGEDDDGSQTSAWQANVILMLWEQWYELWKQRNREVHGHELSEIYRHRTLYETHVQKLLHADVMDHEQHSLRVTQNWLSMNAPIFRDSYRRVKRRVITGVRSIRDYFSAR